MAAHKIHHGDTTTPASLRGGALLSLAFAGAGLGAGWALLRVAEEAV